MLLVGIPLQRHLPHRVARRALVLGRVAGRVGVGSPRRLVCAAGLPAPLIIAAVAVAAALPPILILRSALFVGIIIAAIQCGLGEGK
jgi:hypothetical protein